MAWFRAARERRTFRGSPRGALWSALIVIAGCSEQRPTAIDLPDSGRPDADPTVHARVEATRDAGDAAHDADASDVMVPVLLASHTCGDPDWDISSGGIFQGSTCDCANEIDLPCGQSQPTGRPEARFEFEVPPGRWGCKVTVGEGLAVAYWIDGAGAGCGVDTMPVDLTLPPDQLPGITFGGGEHGRLYEIGIETSHVECGPYAIRVHCAADLF